MAAILQTFSNSLCWMKIFVIGSNFIIYLNAICRMSGCNFKIITDCFRSNSGNHANSMKIPRKLMGFCVD